MSITRYPIAGSSGGGEGGVPDDGSVTNAKVAANAAISADKLADGTTNKILTATERTKLAGIAAGATVYTDEQVRDVVGSTLVAGTNVTITPDDTANTVTIAATGGGGGGAVDSVNGQTGVVTLDAGDVGADPTGAAAAAAAVFVAPPLPSGSYFLPLSQEGYGTSNTMGNSTLRAAPWLVTSTITLDRLAGEITAAGETGSKYRLGIWADSGAYKPGVLAVDAGQIAADTIGVKELTISVTLTPGVYWLGGAIQSAPTTLPTIRTTMNDAPSGGKVYGLSAAPFPLAAGTTLPGAGFVVQGILATGVGGAFASNPTVTGVTSGVPRLMVRVA